MCRCWKFLEESALGLGGKGSFDCVAIRFANGNFAQDDNGNGAVMRDHEYFVYIVCSRSGTLYIGMTNSIYRRALQHKRGEIDGFASKYHCDRLVYYESFDDVHKAIGREKQLKGWSRAKKIALIESKNPRWEDFAEKWGAQVLFAGQPLNKMSS
jgi:putative endonuclease